MNKQQILELRNQAIQNISKTRTLKDGQLERTWLQDEFDLEFARLVIELFVIEPLWSRVDVDDLCTYYDEGWPLDELREHFGINQDELELLLGIEPKTNSWIKD